METQRRDPARSSTGSLNIRRVKLASGGSVTISLAVDLFSLSGEDQEFVLKLVGLVRDYGQRQPSGSGASEGKNGTS